MLKIIGFLIAALVISVNAESSNSTNQRIVGGSAVSDIRDFPYQVSIQYKGIHVCGGTIVTENLVFTTANCILEGPDYKYIIRAGSLNLNNGGSIHHVVGRAIHPKFDINDKNIPVNDFGVIKVGRSFHLDETRQIVLQPLHSARTNSVGNISGWGKKENGYPTQMQHAQVTVIDTDICRNNYFDGELPPGQICAKEYGISVCIGDSGSPLVIDGIFAGLASWAKAGCVKGSPAVYTDVYASLTSHSYTDLYQSWIRSDTRVTSQ